MAISTVSDPSGSGRVDMLTGPVAAARAVVATGAWAKSKHMYLIRGSVFLPMRRRIKKKKEKRKRYNNTTIHQKIHRETRRNNAASTHSYDTHIRCAMSEGAGAEATSSETSGSVAAAATAAATAAPAAASAADPLAAGEAIDELLAANDDHKSSKKRKYPEPDFAVERSGPAGRKETSLVENIVASLVLACGDRTFFLFTYHDRLSHAVSICGMAFWGGL